MKHTILDKIATDALILDALTPSWRGERRASFTHEMVMPNPGPPVGLCGCRLRRWYDARIREIKEQSKIYRLLRSEFEAEHRATVRADEMYHWRNHPEVRRWEERQRYIPKQPIATTCGFCGATMPDIGRARRKYCSRGCKNKAQHREARARLNSNAALRARKREQSRASYRRLRDLRPEAYRAAVKRKLSRPMFRIAKAHRNRIQELVGKKKMVRDGASLRLWGCTADHLRRHLESQFTRGMTWDNYGSTWHVDHRIPLSKFDLNDPSQRAIAFNWQNLQPLRRHVNLRKSAKITDPQMPLPLEVP